MNNSLFDNIKHIDENQKEYWHARELMPLLEYTEWRKFQGVISKAIFNCKNSNYNIFFHFVGADKMVSIGSNTVRNITDYKLSRYACYLIVLNCDPRKKIIALAKTYFAIQTRKQELNELIIENQSRIFHRNLIKKGNSYLNQTASKAGVRNFAKFHNAGYMGLYDGETANDIAKRKGLQYRQDILDYMGNEELVDNLFRIVQTESRLKNEHIEDSKKAAQTHYEIGKNIREVIIKNKGTLPEQLPTPEKSIKELDNSKNKDKLPL